MSSPHAPTTQSTSPARSLIFNGPRDVHVQEDAPLPKPLEDEVVVRSFISAVSSGTELMLWKSGFPDTFSGDFEGQQQSFQYPTKYGYAVVGTVEDLGRSTEREGIETGQVQKVQVKEQRVQAEEQETQKRKQETQPKEQTPQSEDPSSQQHKEQKEAGTPREITQQNRGQKRKRVGESKIVDESIKEEEDIEKNEKQTGVESRKRRRTQPEPLCKKSSHQNPRQRKEIAEGDRVFAFREHTNRFLEKKERLLAIPSYVSDYDASFFPTFETASSFLFDAKILPGENVCVIGQGIVGLAVSCLLKLSCPTSRVISVEPDERRRLLSKKIGRVNESILPEMATRSNEFVEWNFGTSEGADVVIEVSGQGSAINSAINMVRKNGRIVLGSWYKDEATISNLGGFFHRSHIEIKSSQVSEVPAELSGRWNKKRRYDFVWRSIAQIQPFTTLGAQNICMRSLDEAANVYKDLEEHKYIQAVFRY